MELTKFVQATESKEIPPWNYKGLLVPQEVVSQILEVRTAFHARTAAVQDRTFCVRTIGSDGETMNLYLACRVTDRDRVEVRLVKDSWNRFRQRYGVGYHTKLGFSWNTTHNLFQIRVIPAEAPALAPRLPLAPAHAPPLPPPQAPPPPPPQAPRSGMKNMVITMRAMKDYPDVGMLTLALLSSPEVPTPSVHQHVADNDPKFKPTTACFGDLNHLALASRSGVSCWLHVPGLLNSDRKKMIKLVLYLIPISKRHFSMGSCCRLTFRGSEPEMSLRIPELWVPKNVVLSASSSNSDDRVISFDGIEMTQRFVRMPESDLKEYSDRMFWKKAFLHWYTSELGR